MNQQRTSLEHIQQKGRKCKICNGHGRYKSPINSVWSSHELLSVIDCIYCEGGRVW